MSRALLLLHADKAPELLDRPEGPIRYQHDKPIEPELLYTSIGKVYVTLERDDDGQTKHAAYVTMFVHPDLLAQIEERGTHVHYESIINP